MALLEELGELGPRQAPLRADLLPLQVAGLETRNHVRFSNAEQLRSIGGAPMLM